MEGFGVHAFKWGNKDGQVVYVKYHWKPLQGVKNLTAEEAREIGGRDFNHATRDLYEAIEAGNFPQWDLYVQILDPKD
ncbi:catalase, partial [Anoxybacillus sp. LAT_38]|nr:catalase [Anoxybacillus sp. LAT_38]